MSKRKKILKKVRSSAIIKNPLLFEAVGLCPVVAVATSLEAALFLAVLTTLQMVVCEVFASAFLKNVRRYLRVAVYFVLGLAVVMPIMYLVKRFIPIISVDFGVYLPLLAVNSLIALHCERVAVKKTVKNSLIDALSASLSYGAVAVAAGFLRELFGNGTIAGRDINMTVRFPALLLPAGGLLILGFMAAALKAFIAYKYPDASPDRSFDTSEIRGSLHGTFRELMSVDFNPFGDEAAETDNAFVRAREKREKQPKPPKAPKPPREKREKLKKAEPKKKKRSKAEKTENTVPRPRPERAEEHTYLDDFSEMLTELDEYKKKYGENDEKNENDGGGDTE